MVSALELILWNIETQLRDQFSEVQCPMMDILRFYLNFRCELVQYVLLWSLIIVLIIFCLKIYSHLVESEKKKTAGNEQVVKEKIDRLLCSNTRRVVTRLNMSLLSQMGHIYEAIISSNIARERKTCFLPIVE